jgi:hypothetical protein
MSNAIDTVLFAADDQEIMIAAALACPRCLCSSIDRDLAADDYDGGTVALHCPACEHRRTVALTPPQALRLALVGDRPLEGSRRLDLEGLISVLRPGDDVDVAPAGAVALLIAG